MARRYQRTVAIDSPDGPVDCTFILAPRWADTDIVYCDGCETIITGNAYWSARKAAGIHARPGHRIRRLRTADPSVEIVNGT